MAQIPNIRGGNEAARVRITFARRRGGLAALRACAAGDHAGSRIYQWGVAKAVRAKRKLVSPGLKESGRECLGV